MGPLCRVEHPLPDVLTIAVGSVLVESYALSHSMQMADALMAATAMELGVPLLTANDRHYRHIDGLEIEIFRPTFNRSS